MPHLALEAPKGRVLIVEDEAVVRGLLVDLLGTDGYVVTSVERGHDGLRALERDVFDVVLLDLRLPDIDGMSVLAAVPSFQPDAQVVMISGHGTIEDAVQAMKLGAFDYLAKPFHIDEVTLIVERALRELSMRRDVARLRSEARDRTETRMIARHPAMQRMHDAITRVAPLRTSVLITGETGTGKEVVARLVHELSARAEQRFVAVHCAALPESLLESELFGHVKGAFTGAVATRRGLFEEAAGGTLFLDELATIPPAVQVKLLRVLQERVVQRLGSPQPVPVDFRLVAATNVDLAGEVAAGRFREDLYYRLNVYPLAVPPLRERRSDIPLLVDHFRRRFAAEHGVAPPGVSPETLDRLAAYDWPGNVRELEHFMERAVIVHAGAMMQFEPPRGDTSAATRPACQDGGPALVQEARDAGWDLARLEREYLLATLERTQGHQARAAELLGIDRRTLLRKLRQYEDAGVRTARRPREG